MLNNSLYNKIRPNMFTFCYLGNIAFPCLLTLSLLSASPSTLAADAGNSFDTATPITLNQEYTEKLDTSSDEDYYSFQLSQDGNVIITLTVDDIANAPTGDWNLILYNAVGRDDLHSLKLTGGQEGAFFFQEGLRAGSYYVEIDSYSTSKPNPYHLRIDFESSEFYEKTPNGSFDKANPILLDNEYTGNLSSSSDEDYYRFQLPQPGNVVVTLRVDNAVDAPTGDWVVVLYGAVGYKDLRSMTLTGGRDSTFFQEGLPAGSYYLEVDSYSTQKLNQYHFEVAFEPSDFYEKSPNGGFDSANPITLNQEYTGNLSSYSDEDYYRFQLPSGGNVTVTLRVDNAVNAPSASWTVTLYEAIERDNLQSRQLTGGKPLSSFQQADLPEGVYFVRVDSGTFASNQYHLLVSSGPYLPPLGQSEAIDTTGSHLPVTTVFKGGISVNKQPYEMKATQALTDEVDVMGEILVDSEHVGQSADIFVYAETTLAGFPEVMYFMLGDSLSILPWDQQPMSLVAFIGNVTLGNIQTVPMYSGYFLYSGTLKVHFGYRLLDGTVVSNVEPIDITIN